MYVRLCATSQTHLHASSGLGVELLLERFQQGCVEVSGLCQIRGHDFPHHVFTVALKVEVVQGTSITTHHSEGDVALDGSDAAQALYRGNVMDDLWQEGLELGVATDQRLTRSSVSLRNIESHGDINAAV